MSSSHRFLSRKRATAGVLTLALAFSPVLAGLWPALGKGRMLWTGEPPEQRTAVATWVAGAGPADGSAHAGHDGDGHHQGHEGKTASVHDAAQTPAGDHHAQDGSASPSHHEGHCALCVLAALGWAPPAAPIVASPGATAAESPLVVAADAPRASFVWDPARARAPPVS